MRIPLSLLPLSLLLYLVVTSRAELTCEGDSSSFCKCTIKDGSTSVGTIDLSPIFEQGKLAAAGGGYNYDFNGCTALTECAGCSSGGSMDCLVCQVSSNGQDKFGIGGSSDVLFDLTGSDPDNNVWKVSVAYEKGQDGRHSIVEFEQSSSTGMTFVKEDPGLFYHLQVTGPFSTPGGTPAPPDPGPQGGGVRCDYGTACYAAGVPGIVLIIMLMAAALAYVVIGIAVNAGARQKTGPEMIPNIEFWKDFPFLLKDGVVFTFTFPCMFVRTKSLNYSKL